MRRAANFRKSSSVLFRGIALITTLFWIPYSYSQESTLDNYKGTWANDLSWVDGTSPGTIGLSVDLDIYGFITCYGNLEVHSGNLFVHDTLLIFGTLDLGNNADLFLGDNAILIVWGDYISGNQVEVGSGGSMVVTGNWEMLGSDNQGAFDNDGLLFILDPDPDLKKGPGYGDFTCTNPVDSCQQYGYDELIASEIGAFFLGGSFEINASGPTSFCPGGSVLLSTIDTAANYQWYRDGIAIPGATSYSYTATVSGLYHVDFDLTLGTFSLYPVSVSATDEEPPMITAPANQTFNCDPGTCTASGVNIGLASASDNCGIASVTNDAPAVFPSGITTVTWTATDNAGLSSSASHTITVLDNQPPAITAPASVSVSNDAGACTATGVALGTPATSDNCGIASIVNDAPASFPIGSTTVTWIITDNSGLTASATQEVIVTDAEYPVISQCASGQDLNADINCEAIVPDLTTFITATDNCDTSLTIIQVPGTGTVIGLGITTVTISVADDAGNTVECTADLTVTDLIPPTIVPPANVSVNSDPGSCNATGLALGTPTTSDNCGITSITNNAPTAYPVGQTTVTWTVTDNAGLTATASQLVTVVDNQPPVVIAPADISISAEAGSCNAPGVILGTPATSDNCGIAAVVNDAPSVFPVGNTTVTWTVTDNSGLTSTATQIVTVFDAVAPVISTCAIDQTLNADLNCEASVPDLTASIVATDNCDSNLLITQSPVAGTKIGLGVTTVTIIVTDDAGNSDECSVDITILDNTPPSITAPANITVGSDPGQCTASGISLGSPTIIDNCGIAGFSNDAPAVFPSGSTPVTWSVTNNAGLIATAIQIVTVVDNQPPVIANCAVNRSLNADGNGESTVPDLTAEVVVMENCSGPLTITQSPLAGTTIGIGETAVNILVEDAAGNSASCSAIIDVVEDGVPVITSCAADRSLTVGAGCTVSLPDLTGEVTATDNGTIVSITQIPVAGTLAGTGSTSISIVVTDDAGNSSVCIARITVTDEIPPVITAPIDVIHQTNAGSCEATSISLGTPSASDNCSVASITNDAPAIFPLGETLVTWTVTDNAGLTSTDTQTVNITDNQNPVISNCPEDIVINADDYCGSIVSWTEPTASDNCSVTLSSSHSPGDHFDVGTTAVIYTATDGAGNLETCTFNVRVNEPVAPAISGEKEVCIPSEEQYSVSPLEGASYQWQVTGGTVNGSSTGSEVVVTWDNDQAGTVAIAITNSSGCVANGIMNVTKVPGLETSEIESKDGIAGINPYIAELCPGDTGVYFKVKGSAGSSFNWNLSGGSVARNFDDSIIVNWGVIPGEYDVTVKETSLSGCSGLTKRATVLITTVSVELGSDTSICQGDQFSLTPEGEYDHVLWHDGSTGIPFETSTSGTISCTAYNTLGCSATDAMILTIEPGPVVDLGPDITICENHSLDAGPGGVSYTWSTGEVSRQIEITPGMQVIFVEVENEEGCTDRDTILIGECQEVIDFKNIPNAITPNADGKNDVWIVDVLSNFEDVEVEIYDRWGRLIYRSEKGYPTPWDGTGMNGKPVPAGSYNFVFILNDPGHDNVTGYVSVIK